MALLKHIFKTIQRKKRSILVVGSLITASAAAYQFHPKEWDYKIYNLLTRINMYTNISSVNRLTNETNIIDISLNNIENEPKDLNLTDQKAKEVRIFNDLQVILMATKDEVIDKNFLTNNKPNQNAKRALNVAYENMHNINNLELSAISMQIIFEFAKNKKYNNLIFETGGFQKLMNLFKRNDMISMNTIFPLATIITNSDFSRYNKLNKREKDFIVFVLLQVSAQLINVGNFQHAKIALEDSLKIDPENFASLNCIIDIYTKLNDYEKTEKCLRELVEKVPRAADFKHKLAVILLKKNDKESIKEAIYLLKKGIDLDNSQNPENLVFLLFEALNKIDKPDEAMFYLKRFSNSQRGKINPKTYLFLAQHYQKLISKDKKYFSKAIFCYSKALELQIYCPETIMKIALLFFQEKKYISSLNYANKILQNDEKNIPALQLAAKSAFKSKDWKKVEEIFPNLIEYDSKNSLIYNYYIALSKMQQNEIKETYEQFLEIFNNISNKCSSPKNCKEWQKNYPNEVIILEKISKLKSESDSINKLKEKAAILLQKLK